MTWQHADIYSHLRASAEEAGITTAFNADPRKALRSLSASDLIRNPGDG